MLRVKQGTLNVVDDDDDDARAEIAGRFLHRDIAVAAMTISR